MYQRSIWALREAEMHTENSVSETEDLAPESCADVQELLEVQYKIFDPGHKLLNTSELRCMEWIYKYNNKLYLWNQENYKKFRRKQRDKFQSKQGVFVLLIRNKEAQETADSLTVFTNNFNKQFQYPIYIFVEQGFLQKDKQLIQDSAYPAQVSFWEFSWCIPKFVTINVPIKIHANWIPYRHMCRFFSGKLFQHPAMIPYKYFWRLDATSQYVTPIQYDVFKYMENQKFTYGFIAILPEDPNYAFMATGIWDETQKFLEERKMTASPLMSAVINPQTGVFDTFHFWNNFEIAKLDFFTSQLYLEWFEYIDRSFGIYLYRWGDAPVHTVALLTFITNHLEFHWFEDIGYEHKDRHHCPKANASCSTFGVTVNPCLEQFPHPICQSLGQ